MSEYMPQIDAPGIIMHNPKELSDSLTMDLTDDQINDLFRVVLPIREKWQQKFIAKFTNDASFNVDKAMEMVDQFEDELKYESAIKLNLLVTVDVSPVLEGKEMIIDVVGALPGHDINKYGMDYEKKEYQVKKAVSRREDWLGQKGIADAAKAKIRDRKASKK